MIRGIGTDIVKIQRIEVAINRTPSFLEKAFAEDEIQYFNSRNNRIESIAGNFAAKEAISKAIGTGIRGFSLKDIVILRDDLGKPIAKLSKKVEDKVGLNGKYFLHVSISHTEENAIAFAILEEAL